MAAGHRAGRDGEVAVQGPRVLLGGGSVVLPWREELRYGPRKAGYHGGASPAEAVIPLTVLSRGDESGLAGWSAAPVPSPDWWRGPIPVPPPAVDIVAPASGDALFDVVTVPPGQPAAQPGAGEAPGEAPETRRPPAEPGVGRTASRAEPGTAQPAADPAAGRAEPGSHLPASPAPPAPAVTPTPTVQPAHPPLVAELLAAPQYQRNRQLRLAGQPTLPDERVAALLTALLAAGRRLRMEALAVQARVPAQRIASTVTVLRRLLAVEGYQSVTLDPDGQTVVLDELMLRDQFGLGAPR